VNAAEAEEQIRGVSSAGGETGGAVRQAAPPPRRRKRWPIWSEPNPRLTIPCNVCGFGVGHSTVCPFGPEPTKTREPA
jgi:hypothetical protein